MLWTFKESSWNQDDGTQSFTVQGIFGQKCELEPAAPLGILIGAKKHSPDGVQCEQGMFPSEFTHCPYCGSKLLDPYDHHADLWLPPYGAGNGLKIFPKGSSSHKKAGTRSLEAGHFPLPTREGRFAFASLRLGAKQRMLTALQRDTGQLWVYRPDESRQWLALNGFIGGDTLPAWSWSLATDSSESGLCIPADQGPAWVTVNWASNSIQVDRAEGRSIGSPVRLGNSLLAPVLRGETIFMVSRKEGETAWSECSPACDPLALSSQLCRNSGQKGCMGIPVIDEVKQIAYWPCRGGYIRISGMNSSNVLSWEFKPWETDEYPASAIIELGPPFRRTGSRAGFWQLCRDVDRSTREGFVNKIIKLDGDEHVDAEAVECGEFVTTGRASFSWSEDFWDDVQKRNPRLGEQNELRFPLLQFGEKGLVLIAKVSPWEGRDEWGLFSDVLYNRNLTVKVFVRLVVEGSGIPEKALYAEGVHGIHDRSSGSMFRIELSMLPEISAFIYGDSLYVHFPESNECYCWPREVVEG